MGFSLTRIRFQDFRNYPQFELEDLESLTVFVGPNAVGKTNIIEGIQLVGSQRSFRNARIDELIRFGCESASVAAWAVEGERCADIRVAFTPGKKSCSINGKKRKPSDAKSIIPSVVFTPDHLDMVKGPVSVRRRELDALGSQLSKNHAQLCKDYEKILRSKNRLLKTDADPLYLESVNDALIQCGSLLTCYRKALFQKLMKKTAERYAGLSLGSETFSGCYLPSWWKTKARDGFADDSESLPFSLGIDAENTAAGTLHEDFTREEAYRALADAVKRVEKHELLSHRALAGPHMDEVSFMLDGRDARLYGSQGQQRSIVLAYKLAEIDIVQEMLGCMPLLLLDDVMSELDMARRRALTQALDNANQTFITTTNLDYFDRDTLEKAKVIPLSKEYPKKGYQSCKGAEE